MPPGSSDVTSSADIIFASAIGKYPYSMIRGISVIFMLQYFTMGDVFFRSHLREIRDRSVLRLFESADVSGGLPVAGVGIAGGTAHFDDPSYFSEPEFDSEYQHQHIHKSKVSKSIIFSIP